MPFHEKGSIRTNCSAAHNPMVTTATLFAMIHAPMGKHETASCCRLETKTRPWRSGQAGDSRKERTAPTHAGQTHGADGADGKGGIQARTSEDENDIPEDGKSVLTVVH